MAAGLGPAREVRFLIPGESSRSADVLLPHWVGGKDAALDITVVNSFQVATVVGAATEVGHALTHAFNRKMRGTAEACHRQAVAFMPLVVESYGGWHEMGVRGGEAGGGTGSPVRALEKKIIIIFTKLPHSNYFQGSRYTATQITRFP